MLGVHAPHKPLHGVGEILVHLLTITLGLLIATQIDSCMEWRSHVHLAAEARASLRVEIENNLKDMQDAALDVAACLAALLQIALVILLGPPEGLRRLNLGHNALGLEAALGGKLLDFGASLRLLLRRVEEDGRAILRAQVRPLAVEGGGVMKCEEGIQQLLIRDLRGIEVQLDYLGVAGLVRAHVFVTGLVKRAALIANSRGRYAGDGCECSFHAPETSCSKCRFFLAHGNSDAFQRKEDENSSILTLPVFFRPSRSVA
jgi:hypothetical protein